jgi:hypothetical protein
MYNLLVSGADDAWDGTPFELHLPRCVREYTDTDLREKYSRLGRGEVEELKRFPCIFASEAFRETDPLFGVLRDARVRGTTVRIEYETFELNSFLSHGDFERLAFDLDIQQWEMNRTHWALKNVRLGPLLRGEEIILPHWASTTTKAVDVTTHQFDVSLSFPGESREYVERVALELEKLIGPNSYFYDNNYKAQLARPSLDVLLQDIYAKQSDLIVVFLSADYQNKSWCGIEFRAIREIIFNCDNHKIMFIRMDDGDVDGVFKTDGYVDARHHQPEEIARMIQERVEIQSQKEGAE